MDAGDRSAHPNLAGLPWWGAVLVAVTATAVGFAFDAGSGNRELSAVFATCFVLGCLGAVLAVRQSALFTAVIQPPLLLFVSVPGAYFLFHGGEIGGLRDLAINCGYPLIERFPLMFFTSAAVLLIGMGRWYLGMSARQASESSETSESPSKATGKPGATAAAGLLAALTAKISALVSRAPADTEEEADEPPRRRKSTGDRPRRSSGDRPRRTRPAEADAGRGESRRGDAARRGEGARRGEPSRRGERAGARKPVERAAPSRSRHTRPPETEIIEPVTDRPRRSRGARASEPPVPPAEPRRRPRSQSAREPRKKLPPMERRPRYEDYDRPERPARRRRYEDYDPPFEPHGSNGGSHHPVSRVRYRSFDDEERRAEYRTRPRSRRDAEAWEYDA